MRSVIPIPVGSGLSTTSILAYGKKSSGLSEKNIKPTLTGFLNSEGPLMIRIAAPVSSTGLDNDAS